MNAAPLARRAAGRADGELLPNEHGRPKAVYSRTPEPVIVNRFRWKLNRLAASARPTAGGVHLPVRQCQRNAQAHSHLEGRVQLVLHYTLGRLTGARTGHAMRKND
jgi:hypothetical protein